MGIVTLYMQHNDCVSLDLDEASMDSDYLPKVNSILGGDSTTLKIDNETGKIIGWTPIKTDGKHFVVG